MQTNSLSPTIEALESVYSAIHVGLFKSELKIHPVITVQTQGRKSVYGWFWVDKWAIDKTRVPELNISAEHLKRDANDLIKTLAHEMVHQLAHEKGIKDTSRGGRWHNKEFKRLALGAGLEGPPKPDKALGYSELTWNEQGKAFLDGIDSTLLSKLALVRTHDAAEKEKAKGKMLLWECSCGTKIRSGRQDLSIQCLECDSQFSLQGV